MSAVLELDRLTVRTSADPSSPTILDDVGLQVAAGETLGLVGESGSGKSMTLLAVMRLLPKGFWIDSTASIRIGSRELIGLKEPAMNGVRGAKVAMIFQEPLTSLNPAFTIRRQIGDVIRRHIGGDRAAIERRVVDLLGHVRLPRPAEIAASYPHELSGGMRQRAMIAMALSCEPDVLLADEPTTALDVTTQASILQLLFDLGQEHGLAMVLATHDMGVVATACDRLAVMYAGEVVEEGTVSSLFRQPTHPYTSALIGCIPRIGSKRMVSIPGQVPAVGNRPAGCRFAPRCDGAVADCVATHPDLVEVADRWSRCARVGQLSLAGVGS